MQVNRGQLLARLNECAIGLSSKEILEQSDCFVFDQGKITTFNDDVMVKVDNPLAELGGPIVVNGRDLLDTIAKIPDDDVTVTLKGGELRVKGKGRTAGITVAAEVSLPLSSIPRPETWAKLPAHVIGAMQQAARTCSRDDANYLGTVVHVAADVVEACDNFRFLRVDGPTGFTREVLIPAGSAAALEGMEVKKAAVTDGWVYFRTTLGAEIAMRCSHEQYHQGIDALLEVKGGERVSLPANLGEMIERASVFTTSTYDAKVGVLVEDDLLTITSRKDGGWYKERKHVKYSGQSIGFEINPKFLVEILQRSRDVIVNRQKMKIEAQGVHFVVCLEESGEKARKKAEEADEPAGTTDATDE